MPPRRPKPPPVTFARTRTATDKQSFLDVRNTRLLPNRWGLWLLALVVVLCAGTGAGYYFRRQWLEENATRNPVYLATLRRANEHPEVRAALGSPISGGRIDVVEVDLFGGSTHLVFDVEGPKGAGRVDVVAQGEAPADPQEGEGEHADSLLIERMKLTVAGPNRRVISLDGPMKR